MSLLIFLLLAWTLVACSESPSESGVDNRSTITVYSFIQKNTWGILDTINISKYPADTVDACVMEKGFYFCEGYEVRFDTTKYRGDTIKINYSKKSYDATTVAADVPAFDTLWAKKIFAEIPMGRCGVILDSIFSNYQLEVVGNNPFAPELIEYSPEFKGFYWTANLDSARSACEGKNIADCLEHSMVPDSVDSVEVCSVRKPGEVYIAPPSNEDVYELKYYPPRLKNYGYRLISENFKPVKVDTTVHWTLKYTDQYGRSDSLLMTSIFK